VIIATIIYEVDIINIRFYLLDVLYSNGYCKINSSHLLEHSGVDVSDIKILTGVAVQCWYYLIFYIY
jgi:hypothetical protein